ncbi:MAG: hypothetical protein FJ315_01785 [SAR202 cluster bacterium]|nr:hypothetical protein [SAR202 cluster bacterium]
MPRGEVVLARTKTGEPIVRRIWQTDKDEVQIVHEDYYVRWTRYKVDPWVFALKRADVFTLDEPLFHTLEEAFSKKRQGVAGADAELERLWKAAKPYQGAAP